MTPDQLLLKHFKTQTAIAKAAGVTRQAVCNWFGRGSISYPAAVILADKMGIAAGKLQVRWVPSTKRQLNARDARKMMKRIVAQKKALYE